MVHRKRNRIEHHINKLIQVSHSLLKGEGSLTHMVAARLQLYQSMARPAPLPAVVICDLKQLQCHRVFGTVEVVRRTFAYYASAIGAY